MTCSIKAGSWEHQLALILLRPRQCLAENRRICEDAAEGMPEPSRSEFLRAVSEALGPITALPHEKVG